MLGRGHVYNTVGAVVSTVSLAYYISFYGGMSWTYVPSHDVGRTGGFTDCSG